MNVNKLSCGRTFTDDVKRSRFVPQHLKKISTTESKQEPPRAKRISRSTPTTMVPLHSFCLLQSTMMKMKMCEWREGVWLRRRTKKKKRRQKSSSCWFVVKAHKLTLARAFLDQSINNHHHHHERKELQPQGRRRRRRNPVIDWNTKIKSCPLSKHNEAHASTRCRKSRQKNSTTRGNNGIHTVKHWMERKLPTDLVPRSLCRLMEAYWQLELSNMAPVSIFQHNAGTDT